MYLQYWACFDSWGENPGSVSGSERAPAGSKFTSHSRRPPPGAVHKAQERSGCPTSTGCRGRRQSEGRRRLFTRNRFSGVKYLLYRRGGRYLLPLCLLRLSGFAVAMLLTMCHGVFSCLRLTNPTPPPQGLGGRWQEGANHCGGVARITWGASGTLVSPDQGARWKYRQPMRSRNF